MIKFTSKTIWLIILNIDIIVADNTNFCQQISIDNLFNFNDTIYFHQWKLFWRYNEMIKHQPVLERHLPMFFYENIKWDKILEMNNFIQQGLTGFQIDQSISMFQQGEFVLLSRIGNKYVVGQVINDRFVYQNTGALSLLMNNIVKEYENQLGIEQSIFLYKQKLILHFIKKIKEILLIIYDLTNKNLIDLMEKKISHSMKQFTRIIGIWNSNNVAYFWTKEKYGILNIPTNKNPIFYEVSLKLNLFPK